MIIALVVAGAVVVYGLSSLRTDQYQATASMRVVDPNSEAIFDGVQVRVDPSRDVDTQLRLLRSDDLRVAVEQQLAEAGDQITSVSVSAAGTTDIIDVTVTSPDPEIAAAAANAYATIYVEQRQEQVRAGFTVRADELREQAAQLDAQIRDIDIQLTGEISDADRAVLEAQRASLVTQQGELRTRAIEFDVEAATRSGNVELAESASVPTSPSSPNPRRDAMLAAVLALLLGIGLAFLLDRLDDRVKSGEDVERIAAPAPVLGVIPIHSESKKGARKFPKGAMRALVPPKSITAEAYRTLRTSLRFSSIGTQRKTIVVTSSDQAEGKSTVVGNLAVTLADSGLRVVVVSADLRRPTIGAIFGLQDTQQGLTSVLVGDAKLAECLRPVPLASGHTLYVLPAGPLPSNPAELLGSRGMRDIVASIEQAGADYVLIDSPPVLPVSDALALAQFSDGVLVLTVANQTKKQHLAETLDRLHTVNADVVGVVINGVPTRGRYYGGAYGRYGDGAYGAGYARQEPGSGAPERGSKKTVRNGSVDTGPVPQIFAGSVDDRPAEGRRGNGGPSTPAEPNLAD